MIVGSCGGSGVVQGTGVWLSRISHLSDGVSTGSAVSVGIAGAAGWQAEIKKARMSKKDLVFNIRKIFGL